MAPKDVYVLFPGTRESAQGSLTRQRGSKGDLGTESTLDYPVVTRGPHGWKKAAEMCVEKQRHGVARCAGGGGAVSWGIRTASRSRNGEGTQPCPLLAFRPGTPTLDSCLQAARRYVCAVWRHRSVVIPERQQQERGQTDLFQDTPPPWWVMRTGRGRAPAGPTQGPGGCEIRSLTLPPRSPVPARPCPTNRGPQSPE